MWAKPRDRPPFFFFSFYLVSPRLEPVFVDETEEEDSGGAPDFHGGHFGLGDVRALIVAAHLERFEKEREREPMAEAPAGRRK